MHLFKSFIQDLDTSLSALPDNIELILLGDFNVNFTLLKPVSVLSQVRRQNVLKDFFPHLPA